MATCGQCSGEIVKVNGRCLCQECGLLLYPERVWELVHQELAEVQKQIDNGK